MDRGLYVAMTAGKNIMHAQAVRANNLANANTHGFQADFAQARSMPIYYGDGHSSRVYAMTERPATDFQRGSLMQTGRDLDVAVDGDGWLSVIAKDGTEAYTRAGSLQVDAQGILTTSDGLQVLGNGGPISIPPAEQLSIGKDGSITIQSLGDGEEQLSVINRLKLVTAEPENLYKGEDGLMRHKEGINLSVDPSASVASGVLEASNVNAVEQMVDIINLARQYEMNITMMKTMDENAESASSVLRAN